MTEEPGKLPNPESIGFLKGRIVDFNGLFQGQFEVDGGVKIPCVLLGNTIKVNRMVAAGSQVWTVYPQVYQGSLSLKVRERASQKTLSKEGQFFIKGRIKKISERRIVLEIWSVERQREYQVILDGFLKAEVDQYWSLEAALEGDKLVLVDGQMLAAVFNREDFVSFRNRKELTVSIVPEVVASDLASDLETLLEPVVS